jgi:hypothetical protein
MRIGTQQSHLVLQRNPELQHTVSITKSQSAAVRSWGPATRISPIFGVAEFGTTDRQSHSFRGRDSWLLLLGPIHPELLRECLDGESRVWLSLGLFNVIIEPQSASTLQTIQGWAKDKGINYETWELRDSVIISSNYWLAPELRTPWRRELARLSRLKLSQEMLEAVKEYCPLMASTLSRSERIQQDLMTDLEEINSFVINDLLTPHDGLYTDTYKDLGQLLIINAGLSRLSSQTFAGTSPIAEAPCHFWSNSLLGIGVATLGLWRLTSFLNLTLGQADLPERFARLADITTNITNLTGLEPTDPFWFADHLGTINNIPPTDLVPLIPYFSARDGFKSNLVTISAPLATIGSCNSLNWSLVTITHELSHVIIRGVLSELYPNLDLESSLNQALSLLGRNATAPNLLDEVRRYLYVTICAMEQIAEGNMAPRAYNVDSFRILLDHYHHEVEELLVHVFDFLYFYGRDPEKYIRGIWLSWGTLPNVKSRVREYVIRTICATLAIHLNRTNSEETARDQVKLVLEQLKGETANGSYISSALKYINDEWDNEIYPAVSARRGIVRIASTFLFSQSIATKVRGESSISTRAAEREGYTFRTGEIDLKAIQNPLRFLELYTDSGAPSASASAWIFYILAFCVYGNDAE